MAKGHPEIKYNSKGEIVKSPIKIIDAKKFYPGTVYTSYEGDKYIVENYINDANVQIRFLDDHQYSYTTYRSAVIAGNVRNLYHPLKYGGYVGVGGFGRKKDHKAYAMWMRMHERVMKSQSYSQYSIYSNVSIDPVWDDFQNFAIWYYNEIENLNPNFKYSIDKDIFQWGQSSKVYSPETSCLIPLELNAALSTYTTVTSKYGLPVGVIKVGTKYKANPKSRNCDIPCNRDSFDTPEEAFEEYRIAKERFLKEQADYYYSQNAISEKVRNGLYNITIVPFTEGQLNMKDQLDKDLRILELERQIKELKGEL